MDKAVGTNWAGHLDDRWQRLVETVRHVMAAGDGLAYVAHFTDGIYNFAAAPEDELDETNTEARRKHEWYQRIGRQLNLVHEAAEGWTRPLQSGRLIRLIFASDHGAVLHFTLRPHEYIVGIAHGADRIEAADRQMARITDDVRILLALGTENPGGYHDRPGRLEPSSNTRLNVQLDDDVVGARYAQIHQRHVSGADLHYLACYAGGRRVGQVDAFDDDAVAHFFTTITPDARRRQYADIVPRLQVVIRRLGFQFRPLLDGPLSRLVLDVEQGALYYRVLNDDVALLAVTLDQSRVWEAEQRLDKAIAEQRGQ
jgi:hypothetical protein